MVAGALDHDQHRQSPGRDGLGGPRALILIADTALWIGAVLGVCALLLAVAGVLFGVQPLIFRSGSMTPTITAGSLGLAHQVPAQSVRTGDIVSVTANDIRVTHRVVNTRPDGEYTRLTLRGDANRATDLDPYRVRTVDKLWFAVPGLGSVLSWLSRPPGVFVLAGYAAVMLAVLIRRRPTDDSDDHGGPEPGQRAPAGNPAHRPRRAWEMRHGRATFGAVLLAGTAALVPSPSWAAFTDSVPVAGSKVSGYTVPTTSFTCGALGLASVTFNWTAVPGATRYTLHYGNGGASTLTTTATKYTIVTLINGGSAWVTVDRDFGSVTWSSVASTKRSYTVAVVSLCS